MTFLRYPRNYSGDKYNEAAMRIAINKFLQDGQKNNIWIEFIL